MNFNELRKEILQPSEYRTNVSATLFIEGYSANPNKTNVLRIADGIEYLFLNHEKYVYDNDRILGSLRGKMCSPDRINPDAENLWWKAGRRSFYAGFDHFAGNFRKLLERGIPGTITLIDESLEKYKDIQSKVDFLNAARQTLTALQSTLKQYADKAEEKGLFDAAYDCRYVAENKPETFTQAYQLVFMVYILFGYENRYAMAFGRMDQYLYPFFERDVEKGKLTHKDAVDIISSGLMKIHEWTLFQGDDVANIAIGGVKPEDGSDATNELSYVILEAVNLCHIPGPNLSAKIHKNTPIEFIESCLEVIGTGIGYPALMNDDVNIAALQRYGYELEDCRDYCMVGCVENFIQGKQPPWGDGRFNSPKYLELALNNGVCMLTGKTLGPQTGEPSEFDTMDKFLAAFDKQLRYGADIYADWVVKSGKAFDGEYAQSPFLSCFCDGCIESGLDINNGGAKYRSAHGACCMGIATIADSLAAIEKLVYVDKKLTLQQCADILKANFEGYAEERKMMLDCPKYGNNDEFADKYARWFNEEHYDIFSKYKTYDGGGFYVAIASNVSNICAGTEVAATPDGRLARAEMSDAASPMHGMDKNGPTAALLSLSKPDYTLAATGTVVNQKYPPEMLTDEEKIKKLAALIKVYFEHGGQEIQINSVSREVLEDAMINPSKYQSMVVRVSGFSAYYVKLSRDIQLDILKRTEHDSI